MALPTDTCEDTLPPGTPRPAGRDTATFDFMGHKVAKTMNV